MVVGNKKKKSSLLNLSSIRPVKSRVHSHSTRSSNQLPQPTLISSTIHRSPKSARKTPRKSRSANKKNRIKRRSSAVKSKNHGKYLVQDQIPEGFMMDSAMTTPKKQGERHLIESPTYSSTFKKEVNMNTYEKEEQTEPVSPKIQILNPKNHSSVPISTFQPEPLSFLNFKHQETKIKPKVAVKQSYFTAFDDRIEPNSKPKRKESRSSAKDKIIINVPRAQRDLLPEIHEKPKPPPIEVQIKVPKNKVTTLTNLPSLDQRLSEPIKKETINVEKYKTHKKKLDTNISISIDKKGNPQTKRPKPLPIHEQGKKEVDTRLERSFHTLFDNILCDLKKQWNELNVPQTEQNYFTKRFEHEKSIRSYRIVQEMMDAHHHVIQIRNSIQESIKKRACFIAKIDKLLSAYQKKQFPSYKALLYQIFKHLTTIESLSLDLLRSIAKERSLIYRVDEEPPSSKFTDYMNKMQSDLKHFKEHPLSVFFSERLTIQEPNEYIEYINFILKKIERGEDYDFKHEHEDLQSVEKQFKLTPLTKHKLIEAKSLYQLFLDEEYYKLKREYGLPVQRIVFTNVAAKHFNNLDETVKNMIKNVVIPSKFENAALRVQLSWRQRIARKHVKDRIHFLECRDDAATVIQCAYRKYVAQKYSYLLHQQEMQQRTFFLERESAVMTLQRAFRSFMFRKEINYRSKRRYQGKAIITLQNTCRRYLALRYIECFKSLKEEAKKRHRVENKAAVVIQTAVRAWLVRYKPSFWEWLMPRVRAVRKIQRWYRVLKAHLVVDILKSNVEFELMKVDIAEHSAVKIQSWWRGNWTRLEMTTERQYERLISESASKIQKSYRHHLFSKKRLHAIRVIQSHVPFFLARSYFLQLKQRDREMKNRVHLITLTQSRIRTINQMKETYDFAALTFASIHVQQILRQRDCQHQIEKEFSMIVLIQSTMRQQIYAQTSRHSTASEVLSYADTLFGPENSIKQWAAIMIQTNVRVLLAKRARERRELELAAFVVQCKMRQKLAVLWIEKMRANIIEFHHARKNHIFVLGRVLALKSQLDIINLTFCQKVIRKRLQENSSALSIQCMVRQFLSRRRIKKLKKQALYELRTYLSRERARLRAIKKSDTLNLRLQQKSSEIGQEIQQLLSPTTKKMSSIVSPILEHIPISPTSTILTPTKQNSHALYPSTQLPFSPIRQRRSSQHKGTSPSSTLSFQPTPSPSHEVFSPFINH